jgi:hypothetical protein
MTNLQLEGEQRGKLLNNGWEFYMILFPILCSNTRRSA